MKAAPSRWWATTIQDGIKNAVARRTLKDIVISDRQEITGEFMRRRQRVAG